MEKKTVIVQKEGEDRKQYLIRVAMAILTENAYEIKTVIYDEAECDAFCLANDLGIEFNLI